jgi:hypothetical protein
MDLCLAVLVLSKRPGMYSNIIENIRRQIRKPDIVVLAVSNSPDYVRWMEADLESTEIAKTHLICPSDNLNYSKLNNEAIDFTQQKMIAPGLIYKMDDDDWYGPGYLFQMEGAFLDKPEAAIVGIKDVNTRWLYGNFKKGVEMAKIVTEKPFVADIVCGPTICINLELWRKWPLFRYNPECTPDYNADNDFFKSLGRYAGAIYSVDSREFFYQRYPPEHGHGWNQPDPKE